MKHGTHHAYKAYACRCDECVAFKRDADRASYLRNREKRKAAVNAYRLANPELIREQKRAYYAANRDARRAKNQEWREANSERMAEYSRRWAEANPERRREARLAYDKRNPEARIQIAQRRRARLRDAAIIDFTTDQLRARLSMFDGCWLCHAAPDEIDHVKPLAAGGPHCLANLRPICLPCNRRKSSRWPLGDLLAA